MVESGNFFVGDDVRCGICHGMHASEHCPELPNCDICPGQMCLMESCLPRYQGGPCHLRHGESLH
ncbi:MAG: hypothetical protein H7832_10535 [Magnetococcus sp. DMHC-6]